MKVKAQCRCGSRLAVDSDSLANGGLQDSRGRVFRAEIILDYWLKKHEACGITELNLKTEQERAA